MSASSGSGAAARSGDSGRAAPGPRVSARGSSAAAGTRRDEAKNATPATARSDAAASLIAAASPACSTSQKPVAEAPRTAPPRLTA